MSLPKTQALDLTYLPLVVTRLPAKVDLSYAEVLESDHRALFALRARYVSITDTTPVSGLPDARARQRMGEWAKSHEDDLRRWQVANALVVPSSVVRAGLQAIHWFAPPPVPTVVETDLATCLAFLRQHAEANGLALAGLDAYARGSSLRASAR